MRRESSTVVCLVGDVTGDLLAGLTRSPNVSVARTADDPAATRRADALPATHSGLASAAAAMRDAARQRAMYVVVPADPLVDVAAAWQQMWQPAAAGEAAGFEASAAEALAAWRAKRFELPDYYLVMARARDDATAPDLYLGPLRAVRPRRVSVAVTTDTSAHADSLLDALRSLEHGPWWPPLDEVLEVARRFYAGGLAETQQAPS